MEQSLEPTDNPESAERLLQATMWAFGAFATNSNPVLRNIAERAGTLSGTPMAAVSIRVDDRQWLAAIVGFDLAQTYLGGSFCIPLVITPNEAVCVLDTVLDERVADNLMVTEPPGLRFYMGAPIRTSAGDAFGAVCVMDTHPRAAIAPEMIDDLRQLAIEAGREIERVDYVRRYTSEAIDGIVSRINDAARRGDDRDVTALDRILQDFETRLAPGLK